jgi:hypothetical protein
VRGAVRRIVRHTLTTAVLMAVAGAAAAQSDREEMVNIEVDPIKCWWRTSAGAIRVGELFSIVLTCAVVENPTSTVIPDQSQIESAAIRLPPFEVMGGRRFADRRTANHRFFQYEYQARLIQEDAFGRDVALPPLEIKYRIRTRTENGSSVDGREESYLLPAVALRVFSLVADDASDIRDATGSTFADLDAQSFQANLLRLIAVVLFSLGAIMAIQTLVRLGRLYFRRDANPLQLISASNVLRRAARDLDAVRREKAVEGWSEALLARALAALRLVGAYALERRTGQAVSAPAATGTLGHEGHLAMAGGWLRFTKVHVSGSVTAATVGRALTGMPPGDPRRADLGNLQTALVRFSAAQYGRGGALDEAGLDESLGRSIVLARRLAVRHLWPVKKFDALTGKAAAVGRRVWSR